MCRACCHRVDGNSSRPACVSIVTPLNDGRPLNQSSGSQKKKKERKRKNMRQVANLAVQLATTYIFSVQAIHGQGVLPTEGCGAPNSVVCSLHSVCHPMKPFSPSLQRVSFPCPLCYLANIVKIYQGKYLCALFHSRGRSTNIVDIITVFISLSAF